MLEFILAMALTWLFFAPPAALISLPIWFFAKRRTELTRADTLLFVVPWLVWALLFTFGPRPASLSSAIVEALILGCLAPSVLVLRAIGGTKWNPRRTRALGLVLVSVAGIMLWAFMPFLPE